MRVLLADDHQLVRDTIAMFLRAEGFAEVVSVSSLDAAMVAVRSHDRFDVILLDYNMPGMKGLSGLSEVIRAGNGSPVALLSGEASPKVVIDAIDAGAAGFVPKSLGARAMISALHLMASGEVFVPYGMARQQEMKAAEGLTGRETEVLIGLCAGKSNKEIARDLGLQEVTVKLHVKTLCRKLDARNRTHAAMLGKELGLA
jgi:DNA-binding NarL/FixJ family response regulator